MWYDDNGGNDVDDDVDDDEDDDDDDGGGDDDDIGDDYVNEFWNLYTMHALILCRKVYGDFSSTL